MADPKIDEQLIVNDYDEISDVVRKHDEPRKVGEYKPTNAPLSEAEIEEDERKSGGKPGWGPRTTKNIGDLKPLPERPPKP